MAKNFSFIFFLVLFFGSMISPDFASADQLQTIAVFPAKASADIDPVNLKVLEDNLLFELRKLENFSIASINEIEKVLDVEQKKQMLGCDEESCLLDIAGALGVDKIIVINMGIVGSLYAVSVKLINMQSGLAEKQVYKKIHLINGEELLDINREIVFELFPGAKWKSDSKDNSSEWMNLKKEPVKKKTDAGSYISPWVWVSAGVGAVGLGAGIYGTITYLDANSEWDALKEKTGVPENDVKEIEDRGDMGALIQNIGFGVAGAGLAAALIVYFTTRNSERPESDKQQNFQNEEGESFTPVTFAPVLINETYGLTMQGRF